MSLPARSHKASAENNAVAFLRLHAEQQPEYPAIIMSDRIITYRQLSVGVGVIAARLQQQGVKAGDVVGVSMGQNALHMMTQLAIAQMGAVSLPIHPAVPAERRHLAASRFGAAHIVSARAEMKLNGFPFISLAELSLDGRTLAPDPDFCPVTADTPFRIALSSGTSGDPKGMMLTHGLVVHRRQNPPLDVTTTCRSILMDINFVVGAGSLIRFMAFGASVVLPGAMKAGGLLRCILSQNVTHLMLSPIQIRELTEQLTDGGLHCPAIVELRAVGGPLPAHLLAIAKRTLTPNIYVGYGSTEAGYVAEASPDILDRHPQSVGKVCPWAQVEVVDDDGLPLSAGGIGQLRIRTDNQVTGYYLDPVRTARHFRQGWYYPGDLGRFDKEGLLYIEGRADDQLNVGGLKVNPEDIDATITAHEAVIEAGAFVVSQEEGKELLAVAVVLREAKRLQEVERYAKTQLGPLSPAQFFVVPSLPRTMTGKLRRAELTAQFSGLDGRPS